jgi:methyltransferase-like protein/cyclopropane fatty-acyl-phospholipid synthase-like methyltransferase
MAHPAGSIAPNPYDQVAYPSMLFPQTHPDRLATMATLFGMHPAPVERCRVLELGCGDGLNLAGLATNLPDSQFVGLDLAACAIARGCQTKAALGLDNLELHQLDLLEFPQEMGRFDFIIAHGLYSWVPPAVRDKLLAICAQTLRPQGVAYVSYNAYPGCHTRDMVRGMMRYHVARFSEPAEQVRQACALVKFLSTANPKPDHYQRTLELELERLLKYQNVSLYHDDLSPIYHPVYFHEFVAHARQHGLQYLAEASFASMQADAFSEETRAVLGQLNATDVVQGEQYLDFLSGRAFRQTLLCRSEVPIDRSLRPEVIANLHVSSQAKPASAAGDLLSSTLEDFEAPNGTVIATSQPAIKNALVRLAQAWPRSIPFRQLVPPAQGSEISSDPRAPAENAQAAQDLGQFLIRAYGLNFVDLRAFPLQLVTEVSERPTASRLARFQLQTSDTVCTLGYEDLKLTDSLGRHLICLLDGTRDRAALLAELSALVREGRITVPRDGQPVTNLEEALRLLADGLEQNLATVARLRLLTA